MARDNADRHRSEGTSDGGFDLAGCFSRAKPILQALVASVSEGDSLAVATDQNGFPVAQRIVTRPTDLPDSAVIGRHNRCALTIPNDNRVSLRHILLTAWPGKGPRGFVATISAGERASCSPMASASLAFRPRANSH